MTHPAYFHVPTVDIVSRSLTWIIFLIFFTVSVLQTDNRQIFFFSLVSTVILYVTESIFNGIMEDEIEEKS